MTTSKRHSALRDYLSRHYPPQLHGDVETIRDLNALHAKAVEEYEGLVEQFEAQKEALSDLIAAVDAACDYDSRQEKEDMWPSHIRSVLELALQRARASNPAKKREP